MSKARVSLLGASCQFVRKKTSKILEKVFVTFKTFSSSILKNPLLLTWRCSTCPSDVDIKINRVWNLTENTYELTAVALETGTENFRTILKYLKTGIRKGRRICSGFFKWSEFHLISGVFKKQLPKISCRKELLWRKLSHNIEWNLSWIIQYIPICFSYHNLPWFSSPLWVPIPRNLNWIRWMNHKWLRHAWLYRFQRCRHQSYTIHRHGQQGLSQLSEQIQLSIIH